MATVSAEIKVFDNKELTDQDFAMLMERLSTEASGIIYGCGVTKKPDSSNTLVVASGWCLVRGRLIYVTTGDFDLVLPSSGSSKRRIYIEVNLGDSSDPVKILSGTSVPSDNELFNQNNSTSYLELASFTLSNTGISDIVNTRLMNRPPKHNNTINKITSKVLSVSPAATERKILTVAEVNSALGINITADEAHTRVYVSAMNGHWEANKAKINAISFREKTGEWYAHFTSSVSGSVRININITYTPPTK